MADKNQFQQALERLGSSASLKEAKEHCHSIDNKWDVGIDTVFKTLLKYPELASGAIKANEDKIFIQKWVHKYFTGYENRPSQKTGNPPKGVADTIIDNAIKTRFELLNENELNNIKYAHRISETVEMLIGDFLEEYLAIILPRYSWHCAWGATIKAVDFVSENNRLLQIKNRSNSENSSSRAIRKGTTIEHWFRIHAGKGETYWDRLNEICGADIILSEEDFRTFVIKSIKDNPACIGIDQDSPLLIKKHFELF
jgi:hypothetical protein